MNKQSLIGASFSHMLTIGLFFASGLAIGQECTRPPSQTAVEFLRDFETAPRPEVVREIYERNISRDRRFTLQQFEDLRREVVGRFGARPEKTVREPDILRINAFTAGNVKGTEITLLASYPNGRVTQITRLVCERGSWKVFAFEFRP